MHIVFPYQDIYKLSGSVRAMLSVADIVKGLGHKVTFLVDRLPADIKHYSIQDIGKYYPLKHVVPEDFTVVNLWGEREGRTKQILEEADLVWAFTHFLGRIDEHLPCKLKRLWVYEHYPEMGSVSPFTEKMFCNSSYTLEAIKKRNWIQTPILLHPPTPVDMFHTLPFEERNIDIAVLSRVAPDKGFELLKHLDRKFKVVGLGADTSYAYPSFKPEGEIHLSVTFDELAKFLSRAKTYVHFRGYIRDPEHYGISVTDGMASGCVPFVHRSGGPYLDILGKTEGVYGYSYLDMAELNLKIQQALQDEKKWCETSFASRERIRVLNDESVRIIEEALK